MVAFRGDAPQFAVPSRPPFAGEAASHMVRANGLWHHVLEYGDGNSGAAIVLLPGMTAAAATLRLVAEALASERRIFTLDTRGRGLSDHPEGGFALDDYADDLAGVIDRLRLDAPVVVGHSMGARIAAALDVRLPGIAGGLVLADPPLSGPGRAPYPFPLALYEGLFRAARDAVDPVAALAKLEPAATSAQLVERIRWLRACDERAVAESHRGFHTEDYFALHARITAPAVLVRGELSTVVTGRAAAELRALRADIAVANVAGAGHLIPQDNLGGFCAAVRHFLSECTSRGRDDHPIRPRSQE